MSTDPTQNGSATDNVPGMADLGNMLGMVWLNDYQQKLASQRLAYANACGVPVAAGSGAGINLTTINNPSGQQASGPQPVSPPAAPASNGLSTLMKTGLLAAGMATGGAGLLGGGMLLNSFLNKPTPVVVPQQPGSVTIGIDDNGQLINPNANAQP